MTETEKQKMLRGEPYDPSDETLFEERRRAREILHRLNVLQAAGAPGSSVEIVRELLPNASPSTWIQPPFYCDYGYNIYGGLHVYFNFNCVVLDAAPVRIGAYTQFGPNVQIYTSTHPLEARSRRAALESAQPVTIGADCWIGGNAVICPGVTIGDRCVIGAGSVVTKNIPSDSVAVGNPARIIRTLPREVGAQHGDETQGEG